MINNFIDWYMSTRLMWRRIILAILVPASFYFMLEPARMAVGVIIKFNRLLGAASLSIVLLLGILNAIILSLFVLEFLGIGSKIKNKVIGAAFKFAIFVWVLMPIYLMKHFIKGWS